MAPIAAMDTIEDWVKGTLERKCLQDYDGKERVGVLLPKRDMCNHSLNTARKRLSVSRMRENFMSGSRRQGMETRHGYGIEALS